ncbi:Sodium/calcium exchanger protein-domain-containing protein [Pholiota molesta]|nr:Sodium/calcium exchanger protein-domain-containing protein [Pholiota molesta]
MPSPISFEHGLTPSPLRTETNLSTYSVDSACNLTGHGDFVQGSSDGYLPTFHPSNQPQGISPNRSSSFRHYLKIAFHGWRIAMGSWLNVLLVLIPISWAMTITLKASHGLTFAVCILALIPLVRLHDLSTRELANRIGGSKTGLLNGSMSNFVEIVVAISALRKCELQVVQSTLIGSMLSKLLLVLGLCFFAGGMRFSEQGFDATATQVHSSLLSLSVGALLLPAAYHFTLGNAVLDNSDSQTQAILHMSHAVSIVLLFIYLAYLLFQLWSHTYLYNDEYNQKSNKHSATMRHQRGPHRKASHQAIPVKRTLSQADISLEEIPILSSRRRPSTTSLSTTSDQTMYNKSERPFEKEIRRPPSISMIHLGCEGGYPMSRGSSLNSSGFSSDGIAFAPCDLEVEQKCSVPLDSPTPEIPKKAPQLSWFLTLFLLIVVTGAVAVTVDWLVEAMDEISMTIRKEWVGLILLPAISSVAECITAVKVSVKDELTLSVSVAVGSAIQTALLVIPFTVILGWITNKPLSLLMDPFQSMVLYIAVHTMGYVVADGKSNWLEGVILICLYVIIAVSFWFYPGMDTSIAVCIPST